MKRLAIAIVHYHLRPGGVTRVIERAVESLGEMVDVLVLTGESPAPNDALTPFTEPFKALEYCDDPLAETEKLADDLRFTARCLLGRDPDLWHIHNPALGKNSFTPQLVWHLAHAGCRLLLQPHDFAEEGRPENYQLLREHLDPELDQMLYPTGNHIWYAPINFRDQAFLESIGLQHVHMLPNAVSRNVVQGQPQSRTHKTIVYPARAIRRKNMGEFLLWSLLAPKGYRFISTLAPQNPKAQPIYEAWVAFAKELQLPVEFDAGRTTDFTELVQEATAVITTSVAEGFGLAFLEPWLEGKMLIGRNIPEITADFVAEGIDLSPLYCTLPIPLEWIGETHFLHSLESAMTRSYAAYSKEWKATYFEQAKEVLMVDGTVDFGILNEPLQQKVIRHLAEHPADRDQLPEFNVAICPELIQHNRQVVKKHYGLEAYGQRLLGIYQRLAASQPGAVSAADAAALLEQFLNPERVNLLRS